MGRYAQGLADIIRGRRLAARIKHPDGVGFVMWCSKCTKEVMRGDGATIEQQQEAVRAHQRVCVTKGRR